MNGTMAIVGLYGIVTFIWVHGYVGLWQFDGHTAMEDYGQFNMYKVM